MNIIQMYRHSGLSGWLSFFFCVFLCFMICMRAYMVLSIYLWIHICMCTHAHVECQRLILGALFKYSYLLKQDLSFAIKSNEQTNLAGQLTPGISAFWAGWNYKPVIKGIELLSGFWGSRLWISLSTEPSPDPNLFLIMYVLASFQLLW